MVAGTAVKLGNWTVGIQTDPNGCPSIAWGIGELQDDKSPLKASGMYLNLTWTWPRQDPIHCRDADQALAQIMAQGLSVPPQIYEVEAVLKEFRTKLRDKSEEEKKEFCPKIERRLRDLLQRL